MKTIINTVLVAALILTVVSLKSVFSIGDIEVAQNDEPTISCLAYNDDIDNAHCFDSNGNRVANYGNLKQTFGSATERYVAIK